MDREINVLQYDNLVYDSVHSMFRSKSPSRRLKAISGEMVSGQVYYLLSDNYETNDAFVNIISGLVPKDTNTYGYVTYNGIERVWSDWSRRCRVLDLTNALDVLSFSEYLEQEVRFTFPYLEVSEREIKIKKIIEDIEISTGMKSDNADFDNIALIILHILLAPEILIIKDFLNLDTKENFGFLRSLFLDFVQTNNSILILSDKVDKQMLHGVFHYVYNFGTGIWMQDGEIIYSGNSSDYNKQMSLIGSNVDLRDVTVSPEVLERAFRKIRNQNAEKILRLNLEGKLTSSNNLDVSSDNISIRDIFRVMKKRVSSFNTRFIYLYILIIVIIFVLYYVYLDSAVFKLSLSDMKTAQGKDALFIAVIFYITNFISFVPCLSILFPLEIMISEDYSDEFVMGTISPYSFIIARLVTYNLPVYIINSLVILIIWCFEYRKYMNFTTAIYMVLLSFVYTFLYNIMHYFINSAFNNIIITLAFSSFYTFWSDFCDLSAVAREFKISGKFSLAYIVYFDPYFIFTSFLEVASLDFARLSEQTHFYRRMYLLFRYQTTDTLKRYYELTDTDLLDHSDLRPEDLYSIIRLPPSNLSIRVIMALLVGLFIVSTLLFGKKKLVPNVRLKLMNYNKN